MLEARKSRDNVEQQKRLQEQCRVALEKLGEVLKQQGCEGPQK